MKYPVQLFDLELKFAKHISKISDTSFNYCLLHYTDFYKQFRYGTDYNPNNPKWVAYINKFSDDPYYTYNHSIKERATSDKKLGANPRGFGCFSYDYDSNKRAIHLHFANNTHEKAGPLSIYSIYNRKAELKKMFYYIKNKHPKAKHVQGHSWLYNLESYTRLFPSCYSSDTKFKGWKVQYRSYWGQFLDSEGKVKQDFAKIFQHKLNKSKTILECLSCATHKPLSVQGYIKDFYEFYKI